MAADPSGSSARIEALLQAVEASHEATLKLNATVDRLVEQDGVLRDSVDNLVRTHASSFEGLSSIVEKLEAGFSRMERSQTEMRAAVFDRIDRLQGTVDLIKEDIGVNFAGSAVALANARSVRGDTDHIMELVTAMERRYRALAGLVEELRKDKDEDQNRGTS